MVSVSIYFVNLCWPTPVSAKEYVKHLSKLYNDWLDKLTDRNDLDELQEEFAEEVEWYLAETADAIENIKDVSLRKVAKKAANEFGDMVCQLSDSALN